MSYAKDISNCQILALCAVEFNEYSNKDEQIRLIIDYVENKYSDKITFDLWIPNHNTDDMVLFSKEGRYMNGGAYTIKVYQNGEWKISSENELK